MRIKQTISVGILAVLLCAAAALSQDKGKASQEKVIVTLSNNKFEPKTVTIKAGSEVTWENKEGTHTVTADDGSWSSPTLSAGQTFSHKFDKPGKYPYYCTFHGGKGGQGMSGVVNVTR
ncbi:MAG TPA: cupredoxin domain-containing protein [Blastocatellia bacterium]|nr:cupredoxin domain-containing protein [Blastocatellia bacterium]